MSYPLTLDDNKQSKANVNLLSKRDLWEVSFNSLVSLSHLFTLLVLTDMAKVNTKIGVTK